jgi:hypothetical protein
MKDTINMPRFSTLEIDFTADDPGPSLLHGHHEDHPHEGFMGLVTYLSILSVVSVRGSRRRILTPVEHEPLPVFKPPPLSSEPWVF